MGYLKIGIILLVIIILGGIIIFFIFSKWNENKVESSKKAQSIDCGNDLDCFISASESCKPATARNMISVNFYGIEENETSLYEIKGLESDKCSFYIEREKMEVTFPPGTPQERIDERKKSNEIFIGKKGTCKFNIEDLTSMLKRWKEGKFKSNVVLCDFPEKKECIMENGDLGIAQCEGNYILFCHDDCL